METKHFLIPNYLTIIIILIPSCYLLFLHPYLYYFLNFLVSFSTLHYNYVVDITLHVTLQYRIALMSFMCPLFLYHVTRNFRRIKIHKSTQKSFLQIYFSHISSFSHFCTTSFIFHKLYFRKSQKIAKTVKAIGLKSFQQYSILFH